MNIILNCLKFSRFIWFLVNIYHLRYDLYFYSFTHLSKKDLVTLYTNFIPSLYNVQV